jgi:hypothetical protein
MCAYGALDELDLALGPVQRDAPELGCESAVNADQVTELVANLMRTVVPSGVIIEVVDGMIWNSYANERAYGGGRAGIYFRDFLEADETSEDPTPERVADSCWIAMDQLQDAVAEMTGSAWPGSSSQPQSHARALGTRVHVWFGDEDTPDLDCGWIDLGA